MTLKIPLGIAILTGIPVALFVPGPLGSLAGGVAVFAAIGLVGLWASRRTWSKRWGTAFLAGGLLGMAALYPSYSQAKSKEDSTLGDPMAAKSRREARRETLKIEIALAFAVTGVLILAAPRKEGTR